MLHVVRDPQIARGMRRVRLEHGWSLDDVAELFGCDRSRISRAENGHRGTPPPVIVADILGVSVGYLLMPCPRCAYMPPGGYRCLRCGTAGRMSALPRATMYACACGDQFASADDLDAHFLASMGVDGTPDGVDWTDPEVSPSGDTPGIDGKQHYEVARRLMNSPCRQLEYISEALCLVERQRSAQ